MREIEKTRFRLVGNILVWGVLSGSCNVGSKFVNRGQLSPLFYLINVILKDR